MTRRSLNVTPKTTEQHLIVRSGKFEAEASIIKHCARGITQLKLTTDGHKASRGLSATAELLVAITVNASPYVGPNRKCNDVSKFYNLQRIKLVYERYAWITESRKISVP